MPNNLYASLYPSIIREFNVAAHTQIGIIDIPEQISIHENRQHELTYSRGGQFLEDYRSFQWLEIGTRWFGLADFTQLVYDVEEFFKTIMMPMYGLKVYDNSGHIVPMHFCDKKLPTFGMYFDDDIRIEHYEELNMNQARMWMNYAIANPNQLYK